MRNLIITQLYAAYVQGYDTVILGAFGCGYYKNPSQAVAKLYKEVIDNFFKGAFQQIVFAILDDPLSKGPHNPAGNFKPFEEAFQRIGYSDGFEPHRLLVIKHSLWPGPNVPKHEKSRCLKFGKLKDCHVFQISAHALLGNYFSTRFDIFTINFL